VGGSASSFPRYRRAGFEQVSWTLSKFIKTRADLDQAVAFYDKWQIALDRKAGFSGVPLGLLIDDYNKKTGHHYKGMAIERPGSWSTGPKSAGPPVAAVLPPDQAARLGIVRPSGGAPASMQTNGRPPSAPPAPSFRPITGDRTVDAFLHASRACFDSHCGSLPSGLKFHKTADRVLDVALPDLAQEQTLGLRQMHTEIIDLQAELQKATARSAQSPSDGEASAAQVRATEQLNKTILKYEKEKEMVTHDIKPLPGAQ
jgi:hypothetical protein